MDKWSGMQRWNSTNITAKAKLLTGQGRILSATVSFYERERKTDRRQTFSSKLPSILKAASTSCSSDWACSIALKAESVVTAVILRIPLAIPSSDRRANAFASRVFDIWVPAIIHWLYLRPAWPRLQKVKAVTKIHWPPHSSEEMDNQLSLSGSARSSSTFFPIATTLTGSG